MKVRQNAMNIFSKIKTKVTGKSMSEALIFASTNPQYDERLFMKIEN